MTTSPPTIPERLDRPARPVQARPGVVRPLPTVRRQRPLPRPARTGRPPDRLPGCMDGQPEAVRRERFGQLCRAVFPDTPKTASFAGPVRVYRGSATPSTPQSPTAALAREIEAASERATPGSPAGVYLSRRWVLAATRRRPAPHPSPWCAVAESGGGVRVRQAAGLPEGRGGVLVFCYRLPKGGCLAAVSLEALTQDGTRTTPRWRKTYGPRTGAAFEAAAGGTRPAGGVGRRRSNRPGRPDGCIQVAGCWQWVARPAWKLGPGK